MLVQGGVVLHNRFGTAPGQAVLADGKLAAALPGPPREMIPMLENELLPLLKRHFPGLRPIESRNLRLVGVPESRVGEELRDLMESSNPTLAPYVGTAELRLRIAAKAHSTGEARRMIAGVEAEVRRRLGDSIYGADTDSLESVCGQLLVRGGLTLAVAESVTGGLVAHRITLVPGSSRYFKMGVVAYHNAVKVTSLGVPKDAVAKNDAVNPDVAGAMAEGVRALAGAKIGLATTGFAGPDGGTPEEPVGTVYTAVAYEGGVVLDRQVYAGTRASVKEYAAQRALILLWQYLKDLRKSRDLR
jgi:nicotinamide-nucleotide amidase